MVSGFVTVQNLPLWVNGASSVHIRKMISSASRVMSRFWPDMPSTLNIAQSLGRPLGDAEIQAAAGEMIEHRDAIGEFGRVVIGQQEAAGAETDVLGLQERLRQQQVGRRVRLPWRGMMLTDPGFLIAELVEPPQDLQVPVVTLFQPAFRRMRGHREISDFHGGSSRLFPYGASYCAPAGSIARERRSITGCGTAECEVKPSLRAKRSNPEE
jgi:hypothetical protein